MSSLVARQGSQRYSAKLPRGALIATLCVACASAPPPAPTAASGRGAQLVAARRLAADGWSATARAVYQSLLDADSNDDEARAGIARMEAWQGRYDNAESLYRAILTRHPDDAEVRAGLVDTLLWRARWGDARAEIEEGLRRSPEAAPLLERLARLHAWHGERRAARNAIDRASRSAPDDDELRAARDRIYVGEARLIGRFDLFPSGAPDTGAVDLYVMHGFGRLTLSAHSEQSVRLAGRGTAYNGLYALGAALSFGVGWGVALELGLGAPAPVVPAWTARASLTAPLGRALSASLAYNAWSYDSGQWVHLVNPSLTLTVSDAVRLDARYWLALVDMPGLSSRAVHTVGARAMWRAWPRIDLGVEYLYGTQVDRVPSPDQITTLTSHVGSAWLDWLADRAFGVKGLYRIEHRAIAATGATYLIHSLEASVYTRW